MAGDNLLNVWNKFFAERTTNLFRRFTGFYRAVVKETNDPLRIGRLRVFIPELHDLDLVAKDLPWASRAPWLGGQGCGSWHNAIIGDQVFVIFEKGHAYAPVVVGFADPTRRAFYPHQMVHGETPITVDVKGKSTGQSPKDFEKDYLPKDERPMSTGFRDRYGSFFEMTSVGFVPFEHQGKAAPTGSDGITLGTFKAAESPPVENEPDVKHIVMHTKYGHTMMLNDTGYDWSKEFKGKFSDDDSFEEERSKYLVKFFNEEKAKERDQRRFEVRTRYGHKEEYRDVGWKKTRPGEFKDQKTISKAEEDERWMKWRTKGGHFFQMIDTGSDADNDLFVKRLLKTEVNTFTEEEDKMSEDRRMMRWKTRYGFKMALDDRGSDKKDADNKEEPRGNGFIVKGVRDGRGFTIEFNEKDSMNRLMIVSPKSKGICIDDKLEYVGLHTDTSEHLSEKVDADKRTRDNEFGMSVPVTYDFESNTHHIKLDKQNKYVRMKTPQQQGIEMRDEGGPCGTWTETRDNEGRAVFMSKTDQMLAIRDKAVPLSTVPQAQPRNTSEGGSVDPLDSVPGATLPGAPASASAGGENSAGQGVHQKVIILDDNLKIILIKNIHDKGKVQIAVPMGDVEIVAKNIKLCAEEIVEITAGKEICLQAAGSQFVVRAGHVGTNTELRASHVTAKRLTGTHTAIQIPLHPLAPAPPGQATACFVDPPKEIKKQRIGPREFDVEQGCAPNKILAGPVSPQIRQGGGGGGGGGGSSPPGSPPAPGPNPVPPEVPFVPDPPAEPDNFEELTQGSGTVLWYGTSTEFLAEIQEFGLLRSSFANNDNVPPDLDAPKITLAFSVDIARGDGGQVLRPGEDFAALAKQRYGKESLILRVFQVPEPDKLSLVENNPDIFEYTGDVITPDFFDIFEIGTDTFIGTPEFPNVGEIP